MRLDDLMYGTTVQGDIHLSLWKGSELIEDKILSGVEDLCFEVGRKWAEREVRYIFAASDGMLHIELDQAS